MYRVFLAHPKSMEERELTLLVAEAEAAVRDKLGLGVATEIVPGLTDWTNRMPAFGGSWEDWVVSVATGTSSLTGEPLFHAILIPYMGQPPGVVGRITHQIAIKAHGINKPVRALFQGRIYPIDGFTAPPAGSNMKATAVLNVPGLRPTVT